MAKLAPVALVFALLLSSGGAHADAPTAPKRGWVAPAVGVASAVALKAAHIASTAHAAVFGASLATGVAVTQKLVRAPGFWGTPLFRNRFPRFRRANLPVGGAIALTAAALTAHVHPELSQFLMTAAAGMTVGAVTTLGDPIPKQ